jgi:hypothetical protein
MRLSLETIHLLCLFGDSNAIEACQTVQKIEFTFAIDNIPVEIQFYAREDSITVEPRIITGQG